MHSPCDNNFPLAIPIHLPSCCPPWPRNLWLLRFLLPTVYTDAARQIEIGAAERLTANGVSSPFSDETMAVTE